MIPGYMSDIRPLRALIHDATTKRGMVALLAAVKNFKTLVKKLHDVATLKVLFGITPSHYYSDFSGRINRSRCLKTVNMRVENIDSSENF